MPKFIDVSRNRVEFSEEFEGREQLNAAQAKRELLAGDHHLALPLGNEAEVDAVFRNDRGQRLQTTAGFLVYLHKQPSILHRLFYGPSPTEEVVEALTIARYALEVQQYAPSSFQLSLDYPSVILGRNRSLMTAVVTLRDPDIPESDFDALYIPHADWSLYSPELGLGDTTPHTISQAAGYLCAALSYPRYEPN